MPLASALDAQSGLRPYDERLRSEQLEAGRRREVDSDNDDVLTEEEKEQLEILRFCNDQYDRARRAREPFETFDVCWDLFVGNVWPMRWPPWRAKITLNKIRAIILLITAIMTDNKPRISVEPLVPGSEDAADLLRKLVDRDWDENTMQQKLAIFCLYGLIWGTGFMEVAYDPYADGGRGKHIAQPVVPYRMFFNHTASCIEDAEYIIQVEDIPLGWVRRNFPEKANLVRKYAGVKTPTDRHEQDRDYVREGDFNETQRIISAQNVNGNIVSPQFSNPAPNFMEGQDDTVEIRKHWFRDDTLEMYERQKVENGKSQWKPVIGPDGMYVLETVGQKAAVSEIDGAPFMAPVMRPKMEPVMETAWRLKYPNGRYALIVAGRVLLRDIPNPFQIDGFPYAMWKDHDVGTIWGQGEPIALKDPQIAMNRVVSQVYHILDKIGNPSFKLKKGGGVNAQSIKNKPGLIIPMDDMDALAPLEKPGPPKEFFELFTILRTSMADVSGINDAVSGASPPANVAFATIDQLQESGAAPIRLKVRNFETGITRIGKLRVQLIQQYDRGQRPIRENIDPDIGGEGEIVESASSVNVQFRTYRNPDLQGSVEFNVVPISSLSTSPSGVWNRWLSLYDKKLIDNVWWHEKFRLEGWKTNLPRMIAMQKQEAVAEAALKKASKVKPGPAPRKPGQAPRKPAPPSNVPSRADNAAIR